MHELPILTDLVYIILTSIVMVVLLQRLRLPSLLGFIVAGVLVGPAGFGLVDDIHAIEVMAEIGIVLLMFTIGMEVSIEELTHLASRVFGGGLTQIALSAAAVALVAHLMGLPWPAAVLVGLVVSTSSTALVLRVLGDAGEMGQPHGRMSLAILLMQDMAVVVMMLLVPMLAGEGGGAVSVLLSLGRSLLLIVLIYVLARFLLPWILKRAVALRSREVFTLITLAAVMGTAWMGNAFGLSLALGAFIAGLVVSESEFSLQVLAEVVPFRDVLNGLFFVSVGMLVSPELIVSRPLEFLAIGVAVMVGKAAIVYAISAVFRLGLGASLMSAVALCQVGEFGFILIQLGASAGIVDAGTRGLLISVSVLTMMATPVLLLATRSVVRRIAARAPLDQQHEGVAPQEGHVIVVGYGVNGRNVARALRELDVEHVIVELNDATVRAAREQGLPLVFGDATRPSLLEHLNLGRARALVVAISDPSATRAIVALARSMSDDLLIVARTRFVTELEPLRVAGADRVVPEEFETSLELVAWVMRAYGASEYAIARERQYLRGAEYDVLTGSRIQKAAGPSIEELLAEMALEHVELKSGDAAVGRSLIELDLRAKTGTTVVAVVRGGIYHVSPGASMRLEAGDDVVLVGRGDAFGRAFDVLREGTPRPEITVGGRPSLVDIAVIKRPPRPDEGAAPAD